MRTLRYFTLPTIRIATLLLPSQIAAEGEMSGSNELRKYLHWMDFILQNFLARVNYKDVIARYRVPWLRRLFIAAELFFFLRCLIVFRFRNKVYNATRLQGTDPGSISTRWSMKWIHGVTITPRYNIYSWQFICVINWTEIAIIAVIVIIIIIMHWSVTSNNNRAFTQGACWVPY